MNAKKLFDLKNKKGFITGAAQGIGKTIARAFADLGAEVAIIGKNYDKLLKNRLCL